MAAERPSQPSASVSSWPRVPFRFGALVASNRLKTGKQVHIPTNSLYRTVESQCDQLITQLGNGLLTWKIRDQTLQRKAAHYSVTRRRLNTFQAHLSGKCRKRKECFHGITLRLLVRPPGEHPAEYSAPEASSVMWHPCGQSFRRPVSVSLRPITFCHTAFLYRPDNYDEFSLRDQYSEGLGDDTKVLGSVSPCAVDDDAFRNVMASSAV